jgi:hypothetical protein
MTCCNGIRFLCRTRSANSFNPCFCRNLSSCGLQGTLPPKLAQLQQLRTLDLSSNQLSGVVPQEWTAAGAFPALESLRLGTPPQPAVQAALPPACACSLQAACAAQPGHTHAWPCF